ncbi:hypothetical protein NDU88_005115 [Pleurodeles waltl]|uniref:Uncharacterized protein n=1 Tax=Pleurodeles waltl TaxID=8319 RepID=A0AAV7WAK4_PLEWA|nr:hypothetical protein NDU88_005115 [Pleurodeles waltl]
MQRGCEGVWRESVYGLLQLTKPLTNIGSRLSDSAAVVVAWGVGFSEHRTEEAEGEESDPGGSRGAWIKRERGSVCFLSVGTGLGPLTLVQPQREEGKDAVETQKTPRPKTAGDQGVESWRPARHPAPVVTRHSCGEEVKRRSRHFHFPNRRPLSGRFVAAILASALVVCVELGWHAHLIHLSSGGHRLHKV